MIDSRLLKEYPDDHRRSIVSAILVIADSGVLEIQRRLNIQPIVSGAADEDPQKLAERILEYRRKDAAIQEFINLADEVRSEIK